MQRNTGYFPTESLEPCGNRLFSRSALNEGYLFRGSLSHDEAITTDTLAKICRCLDCKVDDIMEVIEIDGDQELNSK